MNRHFKQLWGLCVIGLILITQCFVFIPEVEAAGNILFVQSDGTGTDCSQANPCMPPQAMNDATAGDTIYFKYGPYTDVLNNIYLTIDKPLSLVGGWNGAPSGDVVVDPSMYGVIIDGGHARALFVVNDSTDSGDLITITGFTFQASYASISGGAINVQNGRVDIVDNIFLDNSAGSYGGAIFVGSDNNVQILNNRFIDNFVTYGGGSIYTGSSSTPTLIEGNLFSGENVTYVDTNYGTAIHTDNRPLIVNRNIFMDMPGNSVIDLYSTGPASMVSNNFIIRSGSTAIDLSGVNTSTHQIINNTIVDGLFGIYSSNSSVNILNNIIYDVNTSIQFSSGTVTGSNNLFYNNSTDPVTLTDPVIDEDPLFVSPGDDDYHIQEDSPAMDSGISLALYEDYDGDSRPMGGGYDIGADEVESGFLNFLPLFIR